MRLPIVLSFACVLAAAAPIRLHPDNPHYFLFRGRATVLITSGEHYGSVLNPDFDYRKYLATLAADGLNYTRIFSGSYVEAPGAFGIARNNLAPATGRFLAPWARSATPGYHNGGNKFELDRWDEAYFARLKDFVAEAGRRGIVVEMSLFSSHYADMNWANSPLNRDNNVNATDAIDRRLLHTLANGNILGYQERLVRKIVHELNGFDNVLYEIQNEPWSDRTVTVDTVNPYLRPPALNLYPNAVDVADAESMAWQARVASWIASEEDGLPERHLIAQNYCSFRYPVRDLAPGVSIVNFHYAYPEAARLNYGLGKALAYDETGFAGRDDSFYRKQAWNFLFAGGGTFNNLDYSFTPGREDGTDTEPNGPGGGSAALRRQLGILSEFLRTFDIVKMRPDPSAIVSAPGLYTQTLSVPGEHYAIYLTGAGPARLELAIPPGTYAAEWIDPKTGAILKRERVVQGLLTTPPFEDDIALRLSGAGVHACSGSPDPPLPAHPNSPRRAASPIYSAAR
ncbi:MAG TPA: hypothetical protein VN893_18790 [Bryobacteraceae bacterium]|nr:hypothetical protein [Bryobacteraceae bacterium]